MKNFKYIPYVLLLSLCIKTLIFNIDYASMGAILGLCALVGFIEYKESGKEIKEIEDKITELTKINAVLIKEIGEVKSYVTANKVFDGMKNPLAGRKF